MTASALVYAPLTSAKFGQEGYNPKNTSFF
jgi:hypothetical protein